MLKVFSKSLVYFSLSLILCLGAAFEIKADDPKPEEIIAKHLDSIGTKENRAAIKNQMAIGTAQFSILRSAAYNRRKLPIGSAVIISEGGKMFFGTKYDAPEYPFDEIVYDLKGVNVPFNENGTRSILGDLILKYRYLVSEGLFGGSISTAWSALNLEAHGAKLKGGGKKKIDGRQAYAVTYSPKGNSAFSIKLFFDAENFQHLRTEYQQTIAAPMAADLRNSAQQKQTVKKLTEDFSNFKEVDGLTLPYSYKINYLDDGNTTTEYEWNLEFKEYIYNQKIDAATFVMKQS